MLLLYMPPTCDVPDDRLLRPSAELDIFWEQFDRSDDALLRLFTLALLTVRLQCSDACADDTE